MKGDYLLQVRKSTSRRPRIWTATQLLMPSRSSTTTVSSSPRFSSFTDTIFGHSHVQVDFPEDAQNPVLLNTDLVLAASKVGI